MVLGDPGGGKTTMLRWMATAYLLRHNEDNTFSQIPDTQTLPERRWMPVLIRCRELGEADLCRSFTDFLTQHLYKTELLPHEADVMRAVILDRIARGEILLLVDGLDEITNPHVRMMFCQELERTAARYPDAPMVVTSRIVGYRDMPYRMGSGFEHGVIAELNREDKDLFAQRWVEVTEQHQPAAEKTKRAQELREALHSSDRIERLTGNPMLLTTLALVKRKVGKLPNKRTKLYAEAVSVLLNWNPRRYTTIEEDEAIPQLEYLAYEMCRRGVQRLTEDEVLDLLDKLRIEYPNIRAIRRREPQAFLELLEARSSILIKSGGMWQTNKAQEKAVWEFRHLTFQEYLAARALIDGHYPERKKALSLAEQVAPLAGALEESKRRPQLGGLEAEVEVPESWREALRLVVADCKDDDVDDVLLAILRPLVGEDAEKTGRPRAVLAALCLADEPNIGEETAQEVLTAFATNIDERDGGGHVSTTLSAAAMEVGACTWSPLLKKFLITEYCQRSPKARVNPGSLWGMVEVAGWARSGLPSTACLEALVPRIQSDDRVEALSATLAAMEAAFKEKSVDVPGLIESLFGLLEQQVPASHAAAWALLWLNGGWAIDRRQPTWVPSGTEVEALVRKLSQVPAEETDMTHSLINILGKVPGEKSRKAIVSKVDDPDAGVRRDVVEVLGRLGDKQAVEPLLPRLDDPNSGVRHAAVEVLGRLGDKRAVEPLLRRLDGPDAEVRRLVVEGLGKLGDKRAVEPLLRRLDDLDAGVRRAAVEGLGELGDKQAAEPLLRRLDDPDTDVWDAVVEALVKLGDKRAVEPLLRRLDDADDEVCIAAASALDQFGDASGSAALKRFLTDTSGVKRQGAVRELARNRDPIDQKLLSRDIDGLDPGLDPEEPIAQDRVTQCARKLKLGEEEVRSRYQALAPDFQLNLRY